MASDISDGAENVLMPFDPDAEAAARNTAGQWIRFLNCSVSTMRPGERTGHFHEDVTVVAVASRTPNPIFLRKRLQNLRRTPSGSGRSCLRISPIVFGNRWICDPEPIAERMHALRRVEQSDDRRMGAPQQRTRAMIREHFRFAPDVCERVLNDEELRTAALTAMADNRRYQTAFCIGPSVGTGIDWVNRFDRLAGLDMAWHPFGVSAHGPLATVDNQAEGKFVPLESRHRMVSAFDEATVARWERDYLGGTDADRFLAKPAEGPFFDAVKACPKPYPFFAHNRWYLPVLQPDYDTIQDNLILLDATRAHFLSKTLDELATYGCRNARMVLIVQEAFCHQPDKRPLFRMPFSHLLKLPSLPSNAENVRMSGFLLPFAMSVLGTALAEASRHYRKPSA
jgi:hypothetical protein